MCVSARMLVVSVDFRWRSMRRLIVSLLCLLNAGIASGQEPAARLRIEVRSEAGPVRDADVGINGTTRKTEGQGVTAFTIPPGHVDMVVVKGGFAAASASLDLAGSQQQTIVVDLNRTASVE